MSDEYQLRKDIDRFKNFLDTLEFFMKSNYDLTGNDIRDLFLHYYDVSQVYNKEEIDTKLDEIISGGADLSNYYTKLQINAILSSYATVAFANSEYAKIVHTHNQYLTEEDLVDLDVTLSTLKLVPYSEDNTGVICFEQINKTIDELDINLSMDTMSNGYLKITATLIEREEE